MARLLQSDRAGVLVNILCSNTRCMSAGARAEWACEHMPAAPSSRAKPQHPHASLGGNICGLKRRRESNMLGIRGVRRGIYAYDGKCDGTYLHIRDGARVPIGEVAIERGRTKKHGLQQHTRCMSAGARAEWACEHMPCGSLLTGETSAPACFPRRYICELKRRRESNMLGIRGVRRGIIYI